MRSILVLENYNFTPWVKRSSVISFCILNSNKDVVLLRRSRLAPPLKLRRHAGGVEAWPF